MNEFTLIIGNKNYSSWSLRVWLWMKHLGIEFDEIVVLLNKVETDETLSAYFSSNKVPVLIHKQLQLWDSLAICEYLAELYPERGLISNIQARATMRAFCAEMHSSFANLRHELPMNCRRAQSPVSVSDECQAEIERIQDLWEHAPGFSDGGGEYLFGSFSMADAMFAPVVFRFHRYAVPIRERTSRYVELMLKHPAMVEWAADAKAEKDVIESEER